MKSLRRYIRRLLKEDAMGFVHQMAAGSEAEDFFGGKIDKQRGREIKQAFAKHADHQWLSTIDTVHWAKGPYALGDLVGKGRDELSTTMALPSEPLRSVGEYVPYGLWVKGRITLASDTQDTIYSGFYSDYGAPVEGTEEEVSQRDRSSGRNKRPTMSKSYKNYGKLERGNEYMEKMARNIPYVLDQSTWNPNSPDSTNEALVDNWRPIGIVIAKSDIEEAVLEAAEKLVSGGNSPPSGNTAKDIDYFTAGAVKEALLLALKLGVPIYNTSRTILWSPTQVPMGEALLRVFVSEQAEEKRVRITKGQLRKIIREQMKSWEERQAEMAAWEKKLVAALPKDPSRMSNADHQKVAQVFIDEYGLDQADAFYEDDRGTLADLGVTPYPDLENIRMAIMMAQDKERKANISKSPNIKELKAIDDGLEDREVAYLTYQPIRRGGKVVAFQIEDSETPFGTMPLGHSTFVVDERDAKGAGTTVDKIIKMLEKGGAKLRKRRKPIKHTPPMYD